MADSRRLTTDRFYGGTSQRIRLLKEFLSFIDSETVSRTAVKDWLIENTNAQSRDAIDHHLGFLQGVELIDLDGDTVSLGRWGRQYLENPESGVLFNALQSNVVGFDTILSKLREGPMTDEGIMHLLRDEFEDIEMESPGVATRHREWLQVLGYVDRAGDRNSLTEKGRQLARQLGDGPLNSAEERVHRLRQRLLESEMDCVPAGQQDLTEDIYPAVKDAYSSLCK